MKRILITRAPAQADEFAEKLRSAGFEPLDFPVIQIQPIENNIALERALSKLGCYEWIVFTSVNAVDVVFNSHASLLQDHTQTVKFAAIGSKTAEALKSYGLTADLVPEEFLPEAIVAGLGDLLGKWVLLPRAEMARKVLPKAIADAGGVPHEINVYRTLPAQPNAEHIESLRQGVDVITFTSPSTVENFIAITRQNQLDPLDLPNHPLIACIGPVTEQAAKDAGFSHLVVAKEYTTDGLIAALKHQEVS